MHGVKSFLVALFLVVVNVAPAQLMTLDAGSEFGWWLHRLGETQQGVFKTHHTGAPFVHFNYLWSIKKWHWGPTLRAGVFLEDDMRGPSDSRRRRDRIQIAPKDGVIPFLRYGLHLEYALLQRGTYTLAPAIQYGHLQFWTQHPDRVNFGYRHFTEILFSHYWHAPKRTWLLRLNYTTQRIFLKQKSHPLEKHHLYSWGMSVGMGF